MNASGGQIPKQIEDFVHIDSLQSLYLFLGNDFFYIRKKPCAYIIFGHFSFSLFFFDIQTLSNLSKVDDMFGHLKNAVACVNLFTLKSRKIYMRKPHLQTAYMDIYLSGLKMLSGGVVLNQ